MTLPKNVRVAGIDYSVDEVEEIYDEPNQLGVIIYQKAAIKIKSSMAVDKKSQTLIHELLHACFFEAGIEEQDEDIINRVGIVLHQVMRDNDFNWLREGAKV